MFELFERGGFMMYPLILSSLLMVAVIIERILSLRKKKIIIPEIINIVEQLKSLKDIDLAKNICSKYKGPLPNLIQLALTSSEQKESPEIKELIEEQGRQEIRHLEKWLVVLDTIAVIAPLMGLLGTVLGMIKVFNVIKEQGIGQAAALAGGIYEALFTTVTGLFIAIPALIFFNYFTHKAEDFVLDIEKYCNNLIHKLQEIKIKK
jgi:biopolymer transport protein ExbB